MPKQRTSKAKATRRDDSGGRGKVASLQTEVMQKIRSSQNGNEDGFIFAHRTSERRDLEQLLKRIQAARRGGDPESTLALTELAIEVLERLECLTEGVFKEELQARAYMRRNRFLRRRIVNVGDELHALLKADFKQDVRACQLLRSLHYFSKHPNWLDETTTSIANIAKEYGSKPSADQIEVIQGMIHDTACNALAFDPASIGPELGKLICDAVTQNPQAVPSFFESLAGIWKGLGDDVALYEPLAGKARGTHLRMFFLLRCAKMPPSEDASSPTAKLWPSRDDFIGWLKKHDLPVSKSWLSGLFNDDVKAWSSREELKQWLFDKLDITDPTEAVLSEYWDKHNNAMPSLSSLIGNAKGKGKRPKG